MMMHSLDLKSIPNLLNKIMEVIDVGAFSNYVEFKKYSANGRKKCCVDVSSENT